MLIRALKLFSITSIVVLMAACSHTDNKVVDVDALNDTEERYRMASENLEPFTPISGSSIGAKASDRVFFGYDSAALSQVARKTLSKQASWLKKHANVKVTVEGHCDERGTREYNIALGARRAAAAKKYLTQLGVESSRITTVSYGKERPAIAGSNSAAWAENRRSVTVLGN